MNSVKKLELISVKDYAEQNLDSLLDLVLYGVAKKDAGNKSLNLQIHITPIFKDHLNKLFEAMPEGVYKNLSEFNRVALSVGALLMTKVAELKPGKMESIHSQMKYLLMKGREMKVDEMKKELKRDIQAIVVSDHPDKLKIQQEFEKILRNIDVTF
jgi:hypothetical protein